jgi:dUTP pyrophosphatase
VLGLLEGGSVKVRIVLARQDARRPVYKTELAAGCDLFAIQDYIIKAGERVVIQTGVRIELPPGYEAQVRGRSGLFKDEGLLVATGTIDADYRGEIGVLVANINPPSHWHGGVDAIGISRDQRIAQLVIAPVMRAEFEVVDELSETVRGSGGFGSTGSR